MLTNLTYKLLLLTVCFFPFLSNAQVMAYEEVEEEDLEEMEAIKKVDDILYREDFEPALAAYEELRKTSNSLRVKYHAEICSLLTKYPHKPINNLLEMGVTMSQTDKFYHYWIGRILYQQYEFQKAIESWQKFLEVEKYKSRRIINESNFFINNAKRAIAFYKEPEVYHTERLPDIINTKYSEVAPSYAEDINELFYVSTNELNPTPHSQNPIHIMSSAFDGTIWSKPIAIDSMGYYDEPDAGSRADIISNDGRLTVFKPEKDQQLQKSLLEHDSTWAQNHLNDLYLNHQLSKPHFYINEHQDVLIFSTSKGDNLDLQYSVKANDKWTKPRAFGSTINTNGNEESAFLASDGKTLYFSSDKHGSIGGYDVFKSVYDSTSSQWSTPENLGYPINTIDNDLYFKLKSNGREGFFSSDRYRPDGSYDIYRFWLAPYNMVTGKVLSESNEPISNAYIRFHSTHYSETDFKSYSNDVGVYEMQILSGDEYEIEVFLDHELILQKQVTIKEELDPKVIITLDLTLETGTAMTEAKDESLHSSSEEATTLNMQLESENFQNEGSTAKELSTLLGLGSKFRKGHKAVLKNVYFETGSAALTEEDKGILQGLIDLMIQHPDLKVEIGGHTDSVGSSDFNLELSQQRAENVVEYIISKNIDRARLHAVGYGESRPLASNDDEDLGREINRRIEVVVIE